MAWAESTGYKTTPWRARYKRPDGTIGSKGGFTSEKAAKDFGEEQEALIRLKKWIDPRGSAMPFLDWAWEMFESSKKRLALTTQAKYRLYIKVHFTEYWEDYTLGELDRNYLAVQKWASELYSEYSDSTADSLVAYFSSLLGVAEFVQIIAVNPCRHIKRGADYQAEHAIASPEQAIQGVLRVYDRAGPVLATLAVTGFYSGARWGELVGQLRKEYDAAAWTLHLTAPLQEVNGHLFKKGVSADQAPALPAKRLSKQAKRNPKDRKKAKGRAKTPAGERPVTLPEPIGLSVNRLLTLHEEPYLFVSARGRPLRRSNFNRRIWTPAWNGVDPDEPDSPNHIPAVIPWFTFHECRHTHETWLTEDGIPEVARRARLGQKMHGMGAIYTHVTAAMEEMILTALLARWERGLASLTRSELITYREAFPHLA
ncbi:site-specific integrase [Crossiella sp. SN42]|uniref:tyrosine-type recombinase/integrase n=1 Tax=Crossiella sp. SN42 TaxID=2944808 RepID=UPI00207D3C26|nr:site-specific integrase [Crossiella sp. SN42]MCO1575471.1 site-specific integrase [Crossiella sp. SN42]